MLDIYIHNHDRKSLREINKKLDQIILLLEEKSEINGLEQIIDDLSSITEQVKKTIV